MVCIPTCASSCFGPEARCERPLGCHVAAFRIHGYPRRDELTYVSHTVPGRVALLGDAAACVSLLAGEGTGPAMGEAYVLAGELHRAGGDYARALQAYEAQLRPTLAAKRKAALRLRGFFVPRTGIGLKARDWRSTSRPCPG
jgi:2-polyprenyl-6-methoxyphenol hydroxylase-like FAD-dependent oxidoreductase